MPVPGSGGAAGRGALPLSPGVFLCRAEPSGAAPPLPPPALLPARPSPPPPREAKRGEAREGAMRSGAQRPARPGAALPAPPRPATCPGSPGATGRFRGDTPHPSSHPARPRWHPSASLCGAHLPCSELTRAHCKGLRLFRGLTGFVRLSPSVNCSKEKVREGCVCRSSLHVLQHNKDPLGSLLAPNAQQKRIAGNIIIITP